MIVNTVLFIESTDFNPICSHGGFLRGYELHVGILQSTHVDAICSSLSILGHVETRYIASTRLSQPVTRS